MRVAIESAAPLRGVLNGCQHCCINSDINSFAKFYALCSDCLQTLAGVLHPSFPPWAPRIPPSRRTLTSFLLFCFVFVSHAEKTPEFLHTLCSMFFYKIWRILTFKSLKTLVWGGPGWSGGFFFFELFAVSAWAFF